MQIPPHTRPGSTVSEANPSQITYLNARAVSLANRATVPHPESGPSQFACTPARTFRGWWGAKGRRQPLTDADALEVVVQVHHVRKREVRVAQVAVREMGHERPLVGGEFDVRLTNACERDRERRGLGIRRSTRDVFDQIMAHPTLRAEDAEGRPIRRCSERSPTSAAEIHTSSTDALRAMRESARGDQAVALTSSLPLSASSLARADAIVSVLLSTRCVAHRTPPPTTPTAAPWSARLRKRRRFMAWSHPGYADFARESGSAFDRGVDRVPRRFRLRARGDDGRARVAGRWASRCVLSAAADRRAHDERAERDEQCPSTVDSTHCAPSLRHDNHVYGPRVNCFRAGSQSHQVIESITARMPSGRKSYRGTSRTTAGSRR